MKTAEQVKAEFALRFNALMADFGAHIEVVDSGRGWETDENMEIEIPSQWSEETYKQISECATIHIGKYCDKIDL